MSADEKSVTYVLSIVDEESGEKDGNYTIAASDVRENLMNLDLIAPIVDAALYDEYRTAEEQETFASLFGGQSWTKRPYGGYDTILEQKNYATTYCPSVLAIVEVPKL